MEKPTLEYFIDLSEQNRKRLASIEVNEAEKSINDIGIKAAILHEEALRIFFHLEVAKSVGNHLQKQPLEEVAKTNHKETKKSK